MFEEIISMIEDILDKEKGTINAEDEFRDYQEWDSLAYLSVIAKVDEDYGFVIQRDDFQKLRTIKDLADYVAKVRK